MNSRSLTLRSITVGLLLFCSLLIGCSSETETDSNGTSAKTSAGATTSSMSDQTNAKGYPLPADKDLADLYTQTCQSCHGTGLGSAPKTGDTSAWKPRLAKGMQTLLNNTVNGYGGMPALGSCADCDIEDFKQLINYMAAAKSG